MLLYPLRTIWWNWLNLIPSQSLTCTSAWWGGEHQVGECSLRLCHQWKRLRPRYHLRRYARWTGSTRTLKNKNGWPTQAATTSLVFIFHLDNILSSIALWWPKCVAVLQRNQQTQTYWVGQGQALGWKSFYMMSYPRFLTRPGRDWCLDWRNFCFKKRFANFHQKGREHGGDTMSSLRHWLTPTLVTPLHVYC